MLEQELLKLGTVLDRVRTLERVVAVSVLDIGVARRLQQLLDEVLFFHALENRSSFDAFPDHSSLPSPLVVQLQLVAQVVHRDSLQRRQVRILFHPRSQTACLSSARGVSSIERSS